MMNFRLSGLPELQTAILDNKVIRSYIVLLVLCAAGMKGRNEGKGESLTFSNCMAKE